MSHCVWALTCGTWPAQFCMFVLSLIIMQPACAICKHHTAKAAISRRQMHTGYELLHDNARVILWSINKINIIGVEFTAKHGVNGSPFPWYWSMYQAPGAFMVMIILHLPFGRWSLEVIFQLDGALHVELVHYNFLVIVLCTYKWGYKIDNLFALVVHARR